MLALEVERGQQRQEMRADRPRPGNAHVASLAAGQPIQLAVEQMPDAQRSKNEKISITAASRCG